MDISKRKRCELDRDEDVKRRRKTADTLLRLINNNNFTIRIYAKSFRWRGSGWGNPML